MPHHNHRTVKVYLTHGVVDYLYRQEQDQVVRFVDDCGGLFIEPASTVGNEGSGVWVDAAGTEHQDSSGEFAISEAAESFIGREHAAMADGSLQGQRIRQLEGEVSHWMAAAASYYAMLKEHDIAVDDLHPVVQSRDEPTDDELMGSRGELGTRPDKSRRYDFKVVGTLDSTLGKTEIMEELYDQVKGQRSDMITIVELEKTKVKRDKH